MDKKQFDELWEREERQGLQQRLQEDYPVWLRRRRLRHTMLATVAVLIVSGVSILNFQFSIPKGKAELPYDGVCCNRSGIPSAHWKAVASNILISNFDI